MGAMRLILLLSAVLIFPVVKTLSYSAMENCTSTTSNKHLPIYVVEPTEYHLELFLKPQDDTIRGIANIMIIIYKPIRVIILHAYEVDIDRLQSMITPSFDMSENGITKSARPYEISYCSNTHLVYLRFFGNLKPGTHKLKLTFTTPIGNNKGFVKYPYITRKGTTRWIATTLNKPIAARRVFPCWDQPDVKLTFNISINHPTREEILSNMPKERTLPADENGMRWTYFNKTPPISFYQVAIVVIDKNTVSKITLNEKKNITWYTLEYKNTIIFAQHLIDLFDKSLVSYTQVNKSDIMPKTDYIVMSKPPMKIIESPGLVIIRTQDIKYDENEDFPGVKLKMLKFVGRHMTSQLFDQIINLFSWDDSWFNEALALYLSYYISSEIEKNPSIMDLFVVQILQPALHSEVTFNLKSIAHKVDYSDEIETFLYRHLYHKKGSALIHMLQYIARPENFQKALRNYLSLFKNKRATNDAFWDILQSTLYENQTEKYPVIKDLINIWSIHRGCLVFHVERLHNTNTAIITSNCIIGSNWQIPITYISQSNLNEYNTQWVRCGQQNIVEGFNKTEFVLINIKQSGYYRVNYDKTNWKKIANYLNYKEYRLIHVLNRAQIIDDAYYFTRIGELDSHLFLNIITYLKRETNYIAWYPMFNILNILSTYLQYYPESDIIKPNLLEILDSLLDKIGYEEHPEENEMEKSLRLLATKWACKLGHKGCREAATAKLVTRLNDIKNRIGISSWWKDWIYCTGMMHLNGSLFLQTVNLTIYNQDMETLEYLTCSDNEILLIQYMDILRDAYNDEKFTGTEKIVELYYLIIKKHAGKDKVLQFILTVHDFIEKTFFPSLRIEELWGNIIMNIHSEVSFLQIKEFLQKRPRINKTTKELIQRLMEAQEKKMKKVRLTFKL